MSPSVRRLSAFVWLGLIMLPAAGCKPAPRLERPVVADTSAAFASWQRRAHADFTAEQWQEFEATLQEIKLKLMADKEATGTENVNEAMRRKIDRRAVREVLQLGYAAKLWRLGVERAELERMIRENAMLVTRPGDTASAAYLERKYRDQTARLNKVIAEIRATEQSMAAVQ